MICEVLLGICYSFESLMGLIKIVKDCEVFDVVLIVFVVNSNSMMKMLVNYNI